MNIYTAEEINKLQKKKNSKKSAPTHIIVKLLKAKDKES